MATVFYEYFPMVLEMGPKWKAMSDDEFFVLAIGQTCRVSPRVHGAGAG